MEAVEEEKWQRSSSALGSAGEDGLEVEEQLEELVMEATRSVYASPSKAVSLLDLDRGSLSGGRASHSSQRAPSVAAGAKKSPVSTAAARPGVSDGGGSRERLIAHAFRAADPQRQQRVLGQVQPSSSPPLSYLSSAS